MFAWQATVQDEAGNIVPLPVVTVYQSDGSTLADIYDETGASLSNPLTGTLEGFVQFWANPGKYRIIGKNGGVTSEWFVDGGGLDSAAIPIASHSVAQTVNINPDIDVLRVMAGGRMLEYIRDPSGTALQTADGARWSPAGEATIRHWGAVGDGVTDDTPAMQTALDWCGAQYRTLYIPEPPPRSNGQKGYYAMYAPLIVSSAQVIQGAGKLRSELRWMVDCDGIQLAGAASGNFTTNFYIRDLTLRGRADVSASSTITTGMMLKYVNHSFIQNVWLQDWVDHITIDAGDVGAAMTKFEGVEISSVKRPNPANGFPRYGLSLIGGSKKPQGIIWDDTCRVYAEISVLAFDHSGDGAQTEWVMDLTSRSKLSRAQGIQVYLTNPVTLEPDVQVHGVDYTLEDADTGDPIPPGAEYVGAWRVKVTFTNPPPIGVDNVRLYWSDPTGKAGIRVENGSGNRFGGLVGGWDINCHLDGPQNIADFTYMQIARIGFKIGPNAVECVALPGERTNSSIYEKLWDIDPAASRTVVLRGTPGWTEKYSGGTQTVTGTTPTQVAFVGDDYAVIDAKNPAAWREVEADLDVTVSTTGATAQADFTLEVSYDNGASWSALVTKRIRHSVTGVSGVSCRNPVRFAALDRAYLDITRGNYKQPRYRIMASGVGPNDTWTVHGSGGFNSFLRVRETNPA